MPHIFRHDFMIRTDLEREYAAAAVGWAAETLELTDSEIAAVVAASRGTVRRWRRCTGIPSCSHRHGLDRLNQLRHLLENEFENVDATRAWLHTHVAGFGGRAPLSLITNGEIDTVIATLDTAMAGAFI